MLRTMNLTNNSVAGENEIGGVALGINIAYIITGFFIVVENSFFVCLVAFSKTLRRKEFIIPAGLAIGDTIHGLFHFLAGIVRIYLFWKEKAGEPESAWGCMKQYHNILYFVGTQAMTLMLNAVSIDRCIAMFNVSLYMKLGTNYALKVVGGVYGYTAVSTVVAVMSSYFGSQEKIHTKVCLAIWAAAPWYSFYVTNHTVFFGLTSVGIYVFAMVALRWEVKRVEHDAIKKEFKKRQEAVTKMLLIVVGMTFVLFDIPVLLIALLNAFARNQAGGLVPFLAVVSLFNCTNNVIIYFVKNLEIQEAATKFIYGAFSHAKVSHHTVSTGAV